MFYLKKRLSVNNKIWKQYGKHLKIQTGLTLIITANKVWKQTKTKLK